MSIGAWETSKKECKIVQILLLQGSRINYDR